jgi:hypothetical protein
MAAVMVLLTKRLVVRRGCGSKARQRCTAALSDMSGGGSAMTWPRAQQSATKQLVVLPYGCGSKAR